MTTATTFSRQNDAGSLASTLVLVVVLVLESKGLYSLKIGTPKSFIVLFFFLPQKLVRLSPLKEVKPSPDR